MLGAEGPAAGPLLGSSRASALLASLMGTFHLPLGGPWEGRQRQQVFANASSSVFLKVPVGNQQQGPYCCCNLLVVGIVLCSFFTHLPLAGGWGAQTVGALRWGS